MRLIQTIEAMRDASRAARSAGRRVGLVPTMGALHRAHLELVRRAAARADVVVVSIFVNPLQFAPGEDFVRYPADLGADLAVLADSPAAVVFAPPQTVMYPDGRSLTAVSVPTLSAGLCGPFRPGHFDGVATVVAKLFHIVEPDIAVFGEKDAQQLAIVRQMVRDLNMPVDIESVPTVREADGLAISSRNRYLSEDDRRRRAPALFRALDEARRQYAAGGATADDLVQTARRVLARHQVEPEYVAVVDPDTLIPLDGPLSARRVLMAIAAWVGTARLIDNLVLIPG